MSHENVEKTVNYEEIIQDPETKIRVSANLQELITAEMPKSKISVTPEIIDDTNADFVPDFELVEISAPRSVNVLLTKGGNYFFAKQDFGSWFVEDAKSDYKGVRIPSPLKQIKERLLTLPGLSEIPVEVIENLILETIAKLEIPQIVRDGLESNFLLRNGENIEIIELENLESQFRRVKTEVMNRGGSGRGEFEAPKSPLNSRELSLADKLFFIERSGLTRKVAENILASLEGSASENLAVKQAQLAELKAYVLSALQNPESPLSNEGAPSEDVLDFAREVMDIFLEERRKAYISGRQNAVNQINHGLEFAKRNGLESLINEIGKFFPEDVSELLANNISQLLQAETFGARYGGVLHLFKGLFGTSFNELDEIVRTGKLNREDILRIGILEQLKGLNLLGLAGEDVFQNLIKEGDFNSLNEALIKSGIIEWPQKLERTPLQNLDIAMKLVNERVRELSKSLEISFGNNEILLNSFVSIIEKYKGGQFKGSQHVNVFRAEFIKALFGIDIERLILETYAKLYEKKVIEEIDFSKVGNIAKVLESIQPFKEDGKYSYYYLETESPTILVVDASYGSVANVVKSVLIKKENLEGVNLDLDSIKSWIANNGYLLISQVEK